MSAFRDAVMDDLNVFFNTDEFAKTATVRYLGRSFENVRVVMSSLRERDRKEHRKSFADDNAEAFYNRRLKLCIPLGDLQGVKPKQSQVIGVKTEEDTVFQKFTVRSTNEVEGMLTIEVEVVDV